MKPTRAETPRDKGNVKSSHKKRFSKKAVPEETAKGSIRPEVMIYLHANRLYHVLRLTDNRKLMFGRKRKDDDIYGKINKEL